VERMVERMVEGWMCGGAWGMGIEDVGVGGGGCVRW